MYPRETNRPGLLYLVTEDWFFWAHRLAVARAARDAGYRVTVATHVGDLGDRICAEGFRLEPLSSKRGSLNPLRLVAELAEIIRLYRRLDFDLVHHVSLKPILMGSIAAWFAPARPILNAITGRGYSFASRSSRARLVASIVTALLRILLRRPATMTLLEHEEDRRFVVDVLGVPPDRTAVNRGSGVDLERFAVLAPPDVAPVTIGCAARMLAIKGIPDLVAASRILRARNVAHRLVLAGAVDAENPDAVDAATLRRWAAEDGVEWLGHVPDVRVLWRRAHIAALPSLGGEGVPLALVEAAACGRPLIATDVPGCRDIAQAGVNALLVPPGNPPALADALERLVKDHVLRATFAAASRKIAESGFSSDQINAATLALYARLLAERPGASARKPHSAP